MKKFIAIILASALALSLVGCTTADTADDVIDETVVEETATPEPLEESTDDSDFWVEEEPTEDTTSTIATQSESSSDHSSLPEIIGDEDFIASFDGNVIDTYYEDEMATATSSTYIVSATEMASFYWSAQMTSSYDTLIALMDEDELAIMADEQLAWVNDVNLTVSEIIDAAGDDEFTNIEIAYETMLLYRGRCIELLSDIYNRTGEIDITLASNEAAG